MDGSFDSLLFGHKGVEKLYPSKTEENDVKVPHWTRTLKLLFKGLSVEVKTVSNNNTKRIDQFEYSCRIHGEFTEKVVKEKEVFEQRIITLEGIIEENKKYRRRNCSLINRVKEIGTENSTEVVKNTKRLNQFELKCRAYDQLCQKVVKEKTQLEQKVELLEEVVQEIEKYKHCNCPGINKVKESAPSK